MTVRLPRVGRLTRAAHPTRAGRLAVLVGLALLGLPAATASADHRLGSLFQDDARILTAPASVRDATLDEARALGADRVRLGVVWRSVAPAADAATPPAGFDAADPAAYPADAWAPIDAAVAAIRERGMTVDLNPTAPAPTWAGSGAGDPRLAASTRPDPAAFGAFVTALGRRYGGGFVPAGATAPLPKVAVWSIWSEPNQAARLAPQWTGTGAAAREASPALYRALLDAAWAALQATGHGTKSGDVILIGETAPKGVHPTTKVRAATDSMPPLQFVRRLYCVDDRSALLTGEAATAVGCPAAPDPAGFVAQHPALFRMTGYAHHPYELLLSPARSPGQRDAYVTMADLDVLTGQLDRLMARYGVTRAKVPLYLTLYGYQTDPPDDVAPTLTQQAAWINEAEYLAWRDPRVRTLSQYLLRDDGPVAGAEDSDARWSTFQTGLRFGPGSHRDGRAKPALDAYRTALFLPRARADATRRIGLWGRVRPGSGARTVAVQIRAAGTGGFRTVTKLRTDRHGFVSGRVRVRRSGDLRLRWSGGGAAYASRAAPFTVRRR